MYKYQCLMLGVNSSLILDSVQQITFKNNWPKCFVTKMGDSCWLINTILRERKYYWFSACKNLQNYVENSNSTYSQNFHNWIVGLFLETSADSNTPGLMPLNRISKLGCNKGKLIALCYNMELISLVCCVLS